MTDETLPDLPSAVYIRFRLDYDPATGVIRWLYCNAMPNNWNARWAGKVAGNINSKGYRGIEIDGRRHQAHRLAWLISTGYWPADQIDHINGVRDDNRIANLRDVIAAENQRNMAMRSDNISGCTGVGWNKPTGKWQAYIRANGRMISLGYFTALSDAIAARKAAEIAYGFHPNHGRAHHG